MGINLKSIFRVVTRSCHISDIPTATDVTPSASGSQTMLIAPVLASLILLSTALSTTLACETPVFVYALNLWPADPYEVVLVHRSEPAALTLLQEFQSLSGDNVNVVIRDIPPDYTEGTLGEWLEASPVTTTPWLAVRYPVRGDSRRTVWSGPIGNVKPQCWLDSPVRQQIVRYLLDRRAGVWLILNSGERSRDNAAANLLANELDRLEKVFNLPEAASAYGVTQESPVFPRISLNRNDPAENELIAMLLRSEPDLSAITDQPIVFPIYGRGLVLYALAGAGINVANITAAAQFLVGECACEVKSDNPGLELILNAAWDDQPAGSFADFESRVNTAYVQLEDIRGIIPSAQINTTNTTISEAAAAAPLQEPATRSGLARWLQIGVVVLLAFGAIIWLSGITRRK